MTPISQSLSRTMSLALALGVLGAAVLILAAAFFTSGKFILLPYAAFAVGVGVVLRSAHVPSYRQRFWIGFGAFALATVGLYAYTILVLTRAAGAISLLGHGWRLLTLAVIGLLLNAALARVSE